LDLSALGFDPWFADEAPEPWPEGCEFARVTAVDRGSFLVRNASGEVPAELAGRLAFHVEDPADLPCAGDWVAASYHNAGEAAIIHQVLPRRTFLRRRAPGRGGGSQMIAANVDLAFLVQSCHFDFNPNRLERYLVMAAEGGVAPVVLLTKTDLVAPEELSDKRAALGAATSARIIPLSSRTGAGLEELRECLAPGRTCCLLGSSGVGKTTLINRLLGREAFETRAVSATGEGVHATTRRHLVVLPQGALLMDTPGMRELGLAGAGEGLSSGLDRVAELAAGCRYPDCRHETEPGCAVRAAVDRGELDPERYENFLKLRKESEFHGLSALDKRRKDKAFGRFLKTVKKHIRD
jgi:ribosome biogenesis GTPase